MAGLQHCLTAMLSMLQKAKVTCRSCASLESLMRSCLAKFVKLGWEACSTRTAISEGSKGMKVIEHKQACTKKAGVSLHSLCMRHKSSADLLCHIEAPQASLQWSCPAHV